MEKGNVKQFLCRWVEEKHDNFSVYYFIVDGKAVGWQKGGNVIGPYAGELGEVGGIFAKYGWSPIGEFCVEEGIRLFNAETLREIPESRNEFRNLLVKQRIQGCAVFPTVSAPEFERRKEVALACAGPLKE